MVQRPTNAAFEYSDATSKCDFSDGRGLDVFKCQCCSLTGEIRMVRYTPWVIAAVVVALVTFPLQAAELYWQGGSGSLTDANYTDVVNANVAPTSGDILDFGAGG